MNEHAAGPRRVVNAALFAWRLGRYLALRRTEADGETAGVEVSTA